MSATRFLQYLNTRHPNINFTIEFEENHEISFLDVLVKRNLNTFTTTVHRKTTVHWPLHQVRLFHS